MVKRNPADIASSNLIRESFNYDCLRCGRNFRHDPRRLECSHIFSRSNWSVRFTVKNLLCLCTGCHRYIGKEWTEHEPLAEKWRGKGIVDELRAKKSKPAYGIKRKIPQITKHYRGELKKLLEMRAAGWQEYLDVIDWEDA